MSDSYGPAAALAARSVGLPGISSVDVSEVCVPTPDGHQLRARWYAPERAEWSAQGAILYVHGGGMISGSIDIYDPVVRLYVQLTRVPFLSIGYRLAPERGGADLVTDAYAGLSWLDANATSLRVDRGKIAVMGDSAGGGLAAGVAILARAGGIPLAGQILIYPMLDDRNIHSSTLTESPYCTWTPDFNFTGWNALLGTLTGDAGVAPSVAPARLTDHAGLAPAYVEVGELDIFCAESVEYARLHWEAGIACELHVHSGAPHGYEWYAPRSELTRRVLLDRARVIKSLSTRSDGHSSG